jgi:hypothetical protein
MERVGLMADVQQGTVVTVASDVMINGVPAFARGEQVTVQQVAPNAQRPEYKYTVYSTRLSQWYQLRDEDIAMGAPAAAPPPAQPQPGVAPQYQQPAAARAGGGVDFSVMGVPDWLIGIGGLVMFLGAFFYLWGFGFLFPLMGLGVVILVILDKLVKVQQINDWPYLEWVYIIVGGLSTLLGAISLLRILFLLHGLISVTWYVTPVLEVLASAAVLIGGIMLHQEGR